MSTLDDDFTAAAQAVTGLAKDPGNEAKLRLYGLYKQATSGDVGGKRPGFTNPVGRAKFDAWDALRGTSSEQAKQQYVTYVEQLRAGQP